MMVRAQFHAGSVAVAGRCSEKNGEFSRQLTFFRFLWKVGLRMALDFS